MDVRKIKATSVRGETVEAYVIPEGYVCCLISQEDAAAHVEWRECTAVRIAAASEDGRVATFEIEGAP